MKLVVLDYGSGNLRSAERALRRVGASVEVTADGEAALSADGLVVPGVGAFAACMQGVEAIGGISLTRKRIAAGAPLLGSCVGFQVLFAFGDEHGGRTPGVGYWDGAATKLAAAVLPHIGWNVGSAPSGTALFKGIERE